MPEQSVPLFMLHWAGGVNIPNLTLNSIQLILNFCHLSLQLQTSPLCIRRVVLAHTPHKQLFQQAPSILPNFNITVHRSTVPHDVT